MFFIVIILGLLVGSFLNCLAWRICNNESFVRGRSKCPRCGRILKWFELVPVLSFIIQKARCRGCREKISWRYPIVEIVTALLFLLTIYNLQFTIYNQFTIYQFLNLIFHLFVVSILMVIFLTDLNFGVISDWVVWPSALIIFISQLLFGFSWWRLVLGMAISGSFFGLQYLVSRGRWIGAGDIGLGFLMGAILGWPGILVALFFAYVGGAAVGLILIILKKKTLAGAVPFGAFLAPATIVALFWGDKIANWYLMYFRYAFLQ